ncbi:DEAD/DEAH box helicase [Spiribacter vilamensis]|uniref:SNF2 family DNA or RNA helicase n=1 Tax=Spiribacter vilamensis TaxID=531306 RepID=A0A4Q8D1M3_9GAMM|nr:DEAD/DEAH box helicase [Spiribacter vilamensis]RZU99160.1 SNF2 family DNA or RNA helicase [Spiribacter vilamensis]TVO61849.1 DEAD/DEAH box helicase [Spiribacter vilamensis]
MTDSLTEWISTNGEAAIWADFPRESLEAGEQLIQARAVLDCSPGGQGFFARVQADRRHIHSVDIRVHPLPSHRPVTTLCSCPAGGGCGHAVAAILYYLGRTAPAGMIRANPAISQWLDRARRLAADNNAKNASAPRGEALIYLLDRDANGQLTVTPQRARLRRRGGYGRLLPFAGVRRAPEGMLTAADRRLLRLLPENGCPVAPDDVHFLLQALAATDRAHWQRPEAPAIHESAAINGGFRWQSLADGSQHLAVDAGAQRLALTGHPPIWLAPEEGTFGVIDTGVSAALVAQLQAGPVVPPEEVPAVAEALSADSLPIPAPEAPRRRRIDDVRPTPVLRLTRLGDPNRATRDERGEAMAELHFDYAGHRVDAGTGGSWLSVFEAGEIRDYRRDIPAESRARERLAKAGLHATGTMAEGRLVPDHTRDWRKFVVETVPELEAEGWRVTVERGFPWRLVTPDQWQAQTRSQPSQPGWFGFGLTIEVEGERHPVMPLLLTLIRDNPEAMATRHLDAIDPDSSLLVDLGDGRLVPIPASRLIPMLKGLTELYDPTTRLRDGQLILPTSRAGVLDDLEQADGNALQWRDEADLRRLGHALNRDDPQSEPPATPPGLEGALRPYQREGVGWLQRLARLGLGGVLADDMGLGKTLQIISHLLIEKAAGRTRAPSLVVVPTSLLFNWQREAARFAPGLRVLRLHGPQRHADYARLGDQDLVLTTYSLVVRDIERLQAQPWHLLVLDEAQAVKNPRAQAARAVRTLSATQRLSLTGTPLENHLGELWSQFDFVAPGLLGTAASFKRVYRRPIEDDGDDSRLAALRDRVAPFLLRRTKGAIAEELPAKTEIPVYAELGGDQRALYEQLRLGQEPRVREALARPDQPQSRVQILDALLKLREACCDPRLVRDAPQTAHGSAKLDRLLALIDDLRQSDRRILVFSQFTRMLALIGSALEARGMTYAKLTGETRDREREVQRFQDGEVPIFLISLKAGGTGLNLTAADSVIHYDPWWNPAVTRQATDRAHRIGQDQPVFVYHLLTRDTVEDRIMAMQRDKAELGERLLETGSTSGSGEALDAETIETLFAPLGGEDPARE